MIRGLHAMFYSSQADELRAFLRDKLGFTQEAEDRGHGLVTFFQVPGGFAVQLYQPKSTK